MKGVGAAHELRAHKGALTVEYAGVHILQGITSQVIVTVAGGGCKVDVADTVVLHSLDDLHLIVFRHRINGLKAFPQRFFRLAANSLTSRLMPRLSYIWFIPFIFIGL